MDLTAVSSRLPGPLIGVVAQQVRRCDDPVPLLGNERRALADPWINDELARLALQLPVRYARDITNRFRQDGKIAVR